MKSISRLLRTRSTVKFTSTLTASVFLGLAVAPPSLLAQDKPAAATAAGTAAAPASDAGASAAETAWKDVLKATRPPMPPAEWQTQRPTREQIETFQKEQAALAIKA